MKIGVKGNSCFRLSHLSDAFSRTNQAIQANVPLFRALHVRRSENGVDLRCTRMARSTWYNASEPSALLAII